MGKRVSAVTLVLLLVRPRLRGLLAFGLALALGTSCAVRVSRGSPEDRIATGLAAERGLVQVGDEARRIHASAILVDGHNDLPWVIRERGQSSFEELDIARHQPGLHTDLPRLRAGGVTAQFWSVWVPSSAPLPTKTVLEQIDLVRRMVARYPNDLQMALGTRDILKAKANGRIASLIGVEGGHAIGGSLAVLRELYALGARYMTLVHSESLDWVDSATDEPRCGGLSAFGEEVVRTMNELGMLVDISHVSADGMRDVLRVARAPVIASHSSAFALAPHPRNIPDDVLRGIARNGGVVMVNFASGFLVPESARLLLDSHDGRRPPLVRGTVHDLVDHIDHIVEVAGIDHVGLGSDFDGITTTPVQVEDVSSFPVITQVLLDRGYSAEDIRKILGGNLLRAFGEAERYAREQRAAAAPPAEPVPQGKARRARDLGIRIGDLEPGPWNAITDVPGVGVGHATIIEGEDARTGVTVIVPCLGENTWQRKVPAAVVTGNGYGKAAGFTQVEELGNLEAPIALTNTLAVGTVLEAMVQVVLRQPGNEAVRSVNVVVGETNDGWLNDIRTPHVTAAHVQAAWEAAASRPVAEGCVGAGTGTRCLGYKGGIGTSSRRTRGWTVGVLVQTNFGGRLRIDGRPFPPEDAPPPVLAPPDGDGSCMIVVATDAPLGSRNLERLARRALVGLARTGSVLANGSGDYVIAFSTFAGNRIRADERGPQAMTRLPDAEMTPLFRAVADATEEAILNSLFAATTMVGRDGHVARAIDVEQVVRMFRSRP